MEVGITVLSPLPVLWGRWFLPQLQDPHTHQDVLGLPPLVGSGKFPKASGCHLWAGPGPWLDLHCSPQPLPHIRPPPRDTAAPALAAAPCQAPPCMLP